MHKWVKFDLVLLIAFSAAFLTVFIFERPQQPIVLMGVGVMLGAFMAMTIHDYNKYKVKAKADRPFYMS